MRWRLADLPIRAKLVLVQVITAQVVLTLFAILLAVGEAHRLEQAETSQLDALSGVLALNSASALEFIDDDAAASILASLVAEPTVEQAWLYDAQGTPFARYPTSDSNPPPELTEPAPPKQAVRYGGRAEVVRPVLGPRGRRVGTLVLRSRPDAMRATMFQIVWNYGLILWVGLLLSVGIGWFFERLISGPILRLESTVRRVAAESDLSLRAPVDGDDELGRLSSEFNRMIDQLESRDQSLRQLHDQLERRVQERTAELRESEQFLTAVLSTMLDGLLVITPSGRIREANPAALELLDGRVIGRHLSEIVSLGQHDAVAELAARSGKVSEAGAVVDGATIPIEISVGRQAGEHPFFTLTFRDISERQRLVQMQRQFLSTVSHELRTPMTAIHGALRLMKGGRIAPMPDRLEGVLQLALANSDRMIRLVNDLLDIQRVQNGTFDLAIGVHPVHRILRQAAAEMVAYAEPFGVQIALEVRDESDVRADPQRLAQVLGNLISNAVKYSPRGAEVDIRAERAQGMVTVEVIDRGSGVPENFVPRLFEPFAQADSGDTRAVEGTGLGLSITHAIVSRHGGEIGYRPTIGGGSTFWFTLPAAPPTAAATEEPQRAEP